jgi:hypothetical protein
MSYIGNTFMHSDGDQSLRPSERLSLYLRGQYRSEHRVKRLAQDIDCLPKTAKSILEGHWPKDIHFAAIVRRFGRDVLDSVFGVEIDVTVARLADEARTLEQQLQDIKARARQVKGFEPQLDLFSAAPPSLDREETRRRLSGGGR